MLWLKLNHISKRGHRHYANLWWLSLMMHICVTWLRWIKPLYFRHEWSWAFIITSLPYNAIIISNVRSFSLSWPYHHLMKRDSAHNAFPYSIDRLLILNPPAAPDIFSMMTWSNINYNVTASRIYSVALTKLDNWSHKSHIMSTA